MKYIVMETHFSYAVVLDEKGNFKTVANMNYEVGQTVTDVFEMTTPPPMEGKKKSFAQMWFKPLLALSMCLVLFVSSMSIIDSMPFASVYMKINPEVRIDINKKDVVVGIEGINEDGKYLIEGYEFKKKDLDLVMDELIELAIDCGFLHEGGQIKIDIDSDNEGWVSEKSDSLNTHLNDYLKDKVSVTIDINDHVVNSAPIIIGDTDYDDSDYGVSDYGDSDYGESSYDESDDDSDYDEEGISNYEAEEDQSDYENDDASDYEETSSDDNTEAESDYEDDSIDEDVSDYETEADESNYDTSDYEEVSDYEGLTDYGSEESSDYEEDDD